MGNETRRSDKKAKNRIGFRGKLTFVVGIYFSLAILADFSLLLETVDPISPLLESRTEELFRKSRLEFCMEIDDS